jgi:hypothetical protein
MVNKKVTVQHVASVLSHKSAEYPAHQQGVVMPAHESVDKWEPHPSRRSQKKGPPQGERTLSFEINNTPARPEEPPSSGGVSKGAGRRKSTVWHAGIQGWGGVERSIMDSRVREC